MGKKGGRESEDTGTVAQSGQESQGLLSPDRREAVNSTKPSFLGRLFTVKPPTQRTERPANGEGRWCFKPPSVKGVQGSPSPRRVPGPHAWEGGTEAALWRGCGYTGTQWGARVCSSQWEGEWIT